METKMAETKLRVAIRVRPLRSEEGACAWRIEGENVYQADCEEVVGRTAFRYDAVYGENSATKDVYEGVCRELVDGALRGVNGTIFAYGQTSSGKTFTMQGGDKYGAGAPGLMHLAADHIFSVIEARCAAGVLSLASAAAMAWGSSTAYAAPEGQKDAAKRTGPLHRRAGQALGVAVARQRIQQTIGGRVGRLAGVAVSSDTRKEPQELELVAVKLLEGVVQVQRRPGLRAVDGVTRRRRRGAGLRKTTTLAAASTPWRKEEGDAAAGLGLEDGVVLLSILIHQ